MSFFRHFGHRFESGHEIRHDLERKQDRYEGSRAERRMKIGRSALIGADPQEENEEKEHHRRPPVLKTSAPADAAVVQHGKKNREPDAPHETRKEDGLPRHSIQFERI